MEIPTDFPTKISQFKQLEQQLPEAVASRDLHSLTTKLRQISQLSRGGGEIAHRWRQWSRAVDRSQQWVARRSANCPSITFPDLPVSDHAAEICQLIKRNQVVIVAGETGSGKTTQLPKICLQAGRGQRGMIGHTQPRRIAARSVANRIAEELQSELGDTVGYQVRFSDQTSANSLIKLMTDGILLAEIQRDRFLNRYDTLIIDEAHERSLNIDFLLGYLKKILPARPDLKIIITSATIDVDKFSNHFDNAPVVEVSGRSYPVEVVYAHHSDLDRDTEQLIVETVQDINATDSSQKAGDILVFLSGEREIRDSAEALRRAQIPHLEILPLYARLSLGEQRRIFAPHRGRRVVLSTNVAETSLTVPGIGYVIDTGRARLSRYSYRTKVQRLPIEAISRASANQRAGRCGRVSSGICYRLYTQEDFEGRSEYTDPEILRTNLAAVILQMLHSRIGDIREFPFIDPPDSRLINDGFKLLEELQAVDSKGKLTSLGKQLIAIPLDPRLARMLLEGAKVGALGEIIIIAAGLSIQDPRERPMERRQAADLAHRQWLDPDSDFLSLLKLWQHLDSQYQSRSRNQFNQYCRTHFVSPLRVREWRDLQHQVQTACKSLKLTSSQQPADYAAIHQALLSGLLGQVANRQDKYEFLGTRNRKLFIFPGSGLAKQPPKWIVAGSLMETGKQYALNVAKIDPQWLQPLAAHLVKKTYSEPFYHRKSGQVMAKERQVLLGLTIVEGKKVVYGKIAPRESRQIFIQQALVESGYSGKGEFIAKNQALLEEIQALEDRFRRRDLLTEQTVIYGFYDERIPADICNLPAFEKWRKSAEQGDPIKLLMDRNLLLLRGLGADQQAQFPKTLHVDGLEFELRYRFDPTHQQDGVSAVIPLALLHQVPRFYFDWLVPGMLRDKCIALLKTLPKSLRRHFVPVPEYVDKILLAVDAEDKPLTEVLAQQLKRLSGITVTDSDWQPQNLDPWYQMNFILEDENGQIIAVSRSLNQLQSDFKQQISRGLEQQSADSISRKNITQWDFDQLPEQISLQRGKMAIKAWPALRDRGEGVDLELLDNPLIAENVSRYGQLRLALLKGREQVKYLNKHLFKGADLNLKAAAIGDRRTLVAAIISASFQQAIFPELQVIRDRTSFENAFKQGLSSVVGIAQQQASIIESTLPLLHECRQQMSAMTAAAVAVAKADIECQLARLFAPATLSHISLEQIGQYPRYVRALQIRLEKLASQIARDRQHIDQLEVFLKPLAVVAERRHELPQSLDRDIGDFQWALEEYRVSLFAQQLKTPMPISAKRLQKRWDQLFDQLRRFDRQI